MFLLWLCMMRLFVVKRQNGMACLPLAADSLFDIDVRQSVSQFMVGILRLANLKLPTLWRVQLQSPSPFTKLSRLRVWFSELASFSLVYYWNLIPSLQANSPPPPFSYRLVYLFCLSSWIFSTAPSAIAKPFSTSFFHGPSLDVCSPSIRLPSPSTLSAIQCILYFTQEVCQAWKKNFSVVG